MTTHIENQTALSRHSLRPPSTIVIDGVPSIEHQIDIHLQDLITLDNKMEVLESLEYVVKYHINNKIFHLNASLMHNLLLALLNNNLKKITLFLILSVPFMAGKDSPVNKASIISN